MSSERVYATLRIKVEDERWLDHIFQAEECLRKVGVSFDTGYWTEEKIREWKLDWSLEGAELVKTAKEGKS